MAKIKLYADVYKIGKLRGWLVFSEKGLFALNLPQRNAKQPQDTTLKKNKSVKELENYFKGKKVDFNAKIDWTGYTDFEIEILKKCQLIKYGQTASYKKLARMAGNERAYRAVGNVLAKNRLPIIIPCHRITKSDGKLGGFSKGLSVKKKLLDLEKNGNSK